MSTFTSSWTREQTTEPELRALRDTPRPAGMWNYDGTLEEDPLTGGQKGAKPEAFGLLPINPLKEVAKVYGYGATKYSENNWRKGYKWTLSVSALFRHITAFLLGESVDKESGCHHLAHATFHLFLLMEFERLGLGTMDIPEREEENSNE